jgi:hypothetical protein
VDVELTPLKRFLADAIGAEYDPTNSTMLVYRQNAADSHVRECAGKGVALEFAASARTGALERISVEIVRGISETDAAQAQPIAVICQTGISIPVRTRVFVRPGATASEVLVQLQREGGRIFVVEKRKIGRLLAEGDHIRPADRSLFVAMPDVVNTVETEVLLSVVYDVMPFFVKAHEVETVEVFLERLREICGVDKEEWGKRRFIIGDSILKIEQTIADAVSTVSPDERELSILPPEEKQTSSGGIRIYN